MKKPEGVEVVIVFPTTVYDRLAKWGEKHDMTVGFLLRLLAEGHLEKIA